MLSQQLHVQFRHLRHFNAQLRLSQQIHTQSTFSRKLRLQQEQADNFIVILILFLGSLANCTLTIDLTSAHGWALLIYNSEKKEKDLTQSYDKSPYTHRKIQKAMWQHKSSVTHKKKSRKQRDNTKNATKT